MTCKQEDLEEISAAAKDEIGESRANLQESVETVKQLIRQQYPDLKFPPDIDDFVERCLRLSKFNFTKTARQVHLYFKFLLDCCIMHQDMLFLPSIQKNYFFDSLGTAVLKNRDSQGRRVLLTRMERLPSATFSLDKALATCAMALDELTRCSVDTQRLGIVFVCDFKGYGFGHAKQFTLSRVKACAKMIQGSVPIRFIGFHVIRSPLLFTYTFKLMRPFLGEKLKNRIHLHSNNLTEFYKEVSPEILPKYLGGKIPDNEYADLEFNQALFSKDDYYKELFQCGYFANKENDHYSFR